MRIPHELGDEFPDQASLIGRLTKTNYEFGRLAAAYDEVNRQIWRIESEDVCLSQIKSGYIDDAIHLRSDGKEFVQLSERSAVPAHPCPTIDACVPHCSIACTKAGRDEDAARRALQHGRGIPVGPNRSNVQHIRFATGNAETSVDRECPLIEVVG
jgi:uncharacterized protein YdcH (DUF465 family)